MTSTSTTSMAIGSATFSTFLERLPCHSTVIISCWITDTMMWWSLLRYILECSEKTKSFNLKIPQPDSERRHSPDFKTVFEIMIGPFSFCEIGKTWGTNKKVNKQTNKNWNFQFPILNTLKIGPPPYSTFWNICNWLIYRPCRLIWCTVGGCGARAESRKTPIYFICYIVCIFILSWKK